MSRRHPLGLGLILALASLGNATSAFAQDTPTGSAPLPALPPPSTPVPTAPPPPPPPPYQASPFQAPPPQPFTPPGQAEAIQFEPESPDVALLTRSGVVPVSRLTRFRRTWYYERGLVAGYAPLCDGPCTVALPRGEHHLALSKGGGHAVPAPPVFVDRPSTLHAEFADRSGVRAAGVVVGVAGIVGGIVMFAEAVGTRQVCDPSGCYEADRVNGGLVAGGVVTILVGSIVGSILALQPDRAYLTVTPLTLSPTGRARESGDALTGAFGPPQGAGLTVRF